MINFEVKEGLVPEDVFFIHGNLCSNRWWYPAEEIWKRQAKGKNYPGALIYGEVRGCGKSTPPKDSSEINLNALADDFISVIKKLGRGPTHLVGHSLGGIVASVMMFKEPGLFKKAVLLDPVGARGITFDPSMPAAFEQMKQDKNLTGVVIGSTIYNNNPETDFFKQIVVEDAFHAVKTVGSWVLQAVDGIDLREDMKKVSNEVLVLHGEFDQLLPMDDSKALAGLFSRGQFRVVEGQGHCTNVEDPEKFVNIVREYLF